MDYLWSPWRFQYVSEGIRHAGCVFCEKIGQDSSRDRENLILHRARHNFVLLNLFPYATGHLMVVPYVHAAVLTDFDLPTLAEMMELARKSQTALATSYHAEGYNLGMNLGRSAGAGVADHLHLHFLPRWNGDTNFMSVIGETRVLPEDLFTTYDKLVAFFRHTG